jgi:hypothetical protein
MSSKTDALISSLSSQLKPVKVIKFTVFDILKVIVAGFFCLFSAVALLGLRTDFSDQILSAHFILESLLLMVLGVVSIVAAYNLSVPALEGQRLYKVPFIAFALILLSTFYSLLASSDPFLYLGHGFACVTQIISISILPASILFYLIRRAAVFNRDIVGVLVLVTGVSFGLLGVQLTCADSTPMHLILWHIFPSLIVMVFGIGLARKIIKKI